MEWWVWVIIAVVALVVVLAFFEWRSWNKPLSRGLEHGPHGVGPHTVLPIADRGDLERPHE